MEKLNSLFRTLKRSSFYIGGVVGLCFVAAWWGEKKARCELFGRDSNFIAIQIKVAATWTSKQSEMKTTTLTTESSKEHSTSPKD